MEHPIGNLMNITMDKIKELAKQLKVDCPDNDCRLFLNTYNMWDGLRQDLRGCLLSEYGEMVLKSKQKYLEIELSDMYFTNYAVQNYRREHKAT